MTNHVDEYFDFDPDFEAEAEWDLQEHETQTAHSEEGIKEVKDEHYPACNTDGCHLGIHPAQLPWLELMSAVARPDAEGLIPNDHEFLTPPKWVMEQQLNSVRPSDNHAVEPMAESWRILGSQLDLLPDQIKSELGKLADGWEGGDFDVLEENVNELRKYISETADDVNEIRRELTSAVSEIMGAQFGGDNGPSYPQAEIYIDERFKTRHDRVHIRPPWHGYKCHDIKAKDASKKLGGHVDYEYEFDEYRKNRSANLRQDNPDISWDESQEIANEELDRYAGEIGGTVDRQQQAFAIKINEDIFYRHGSVQDGIAKTTFSVEPRVPAFGGDEEDHEVDPGLDDIDRIGEGPVPAGLDDLGDIAPDPQIPLPDPTAPPGMNRDGGVGSGIGGSHLPGEGMAASPSDNVTENAWGLPSEDQDEFSDGLYSGGAGGSAGGGIGSAGIGGGSGPGLGAGAGAAAGGMPGLGASGAGAGAGRAGGSSSAGRGSSRGAGGMMPMGGGRGGSGGTDQAEGKNDDWLEEDRDVWGLLSEEDDPFA